MTFLLPPSAKAHVFWGAPFDFFLMGCSNTLWFAWNFGDEMGFACIVCKLSTRQGSTRKHDRKGDSTTLWWEAFLIPGTCWSWDDLYRKIYGETSVSLIRDGSFVNFFPEINFLWFLQPTDGEARKTEIRRNLLAICWRCWQYLHGISAYDPLAIWYTIWLWLTTRKMVVFYG